MYQSKSFVSQSQCWGPHCSCPADQDKKPACPEPSGCGCALERLLAPAGSQRKGHAESASLMCYTHSQSELVAHTRLSPDTDLWPHSSCQLLKTPRSKLHLSSHHSGGRETALSLFGHMSANTVCAEMNV